MTEDIWISGKSVGPCERELDGALAWRPLPDNHELVVYPLTFGRARLVIGRRGDGGYADGW